MQTVGAQELMLTLTSATLVAWIQTAAGLPVVLLSVPASAIGDLVDRRRLPSEEQRWVSRRRLAQRCPCRTQGVTTTPLVPRTRTGRQVLPPQTTSASQIA